MRASGSWGAYERLLWLTEGNDGQTETAASGLLMITLVVLSTVPGSFRPHTGASGNVEHFVAYAGTAFLAEVGLPSLKGWRTPALLSLTSAVFEVMQIWIPGRGAGIANWAASSAGALVGTVIGVVVLRLLCKIVSGSGAA